MMCAGEAVEARAAGAHPLVVHRGVLTVDGLAVRTGVELHIANLRYLYIGLPGVGTAIIADRPFAGAQEERGAFHGDALTVDAGGSRLQLTAAHRLHGSHAAYVHFDRVAGPRNGRAEVSYGEAAMVPAVWTGALPEEHFAARHARVRKTRALRTAKLCRPSRKGPELCATVREGMFNR